MNKTLILLANILDTAIEHGLVPSNPARGKRRRLEAARPTRRFLEADELTELLAIPGGLDRSARSDQRIGRRPLIAVMAKSGLRVGEGCALRWRSVDTAHQRLVIEHAKTAAGVREVDLSLDLIEELNAWSAERKPRASTSSCSRLPVVDRATRTVFENAYVRRWSIAPTRSAQSAHRSSCEDHAARAAPHVHQPDARAAPRCRM
ncbi:MAG: tyrosine-type recombinase/integrase [Solirubrobacteraceae bacterium]